MADNFSLKTSLEGEKEFKKALGEINNLSMDEVWLMPFGLLLDLWECDKQYNGISKPKREHFIDDIIPEGF